MCWCLQAMTLAVNLTKVSLELFAKLSIGLCVQVWRVLVHCIVKSYNVPKAYWNPVKNKRIFLKKTAWHGTWSHWIAQLWIHLRMRQEMSRFVSFCLFVQETKDCGLKASFQKRSFVNNNQLLCSSNWQFFSFSFQVRISCCPKTKSAWVVLRCWCLKNVCLHFGLAAKGHPNHRLICAPTPKRTPHGSGRSAQNEALILFFCPDLLIIFLCAARFRLPKGCVSWSDEKLTSTQFGFSLISRNVMPLNFQWEKCFFYSGVGPWGLFINLHFLLNPLHGYPLCCA